MWFVSWPVGFILTLFWPFLLVWGLFGVVDGVGKVVMELTAGNGGGEGNLKGGDLEKGDKEGNEGREGGGGGQGGGEEGDVKGTGVDGAIGGPLAVKGS